MKLPAGDATVFPKIVKLMCVIFAVVNNAVVRRRDDANVPRVATRIG